MSDIARPFTGLRPTPGKEAEIAAPPYDVVSVEEAGAFAAQRPNSFFHVSRAEIDLPAKTDPYSTVVYDRAAENLTRFVQQGVLQRDAEPAFYIYRMDSEYGSQTGVAFSASVDAYLDNRIRKHELTRPTKETDRVRQIAAVNASTGPVLLVYRHHTALDNLLAELCASPPDNVVPELDGTRHTLWAVREKASIDTIAAYFNEMAYLYIADGHHRSAAAARVAEERRADNTTTGYQPYDGFLAIAFPDTAVRILDYNRVIKDLNGYEKDEFLRAVGQRFTINPLAQTKKPTAPHHFAMYLADEWYGLEFTGDIAEDDPVARLDVTLLDNTILKPLLGIDDPRTNPRIDFVGGTRGLESLERRVDSGEMAVAFALYPTSMGDLMAVADANLIMPPKSTWFAPKLADGLISLPLD